MIKKSQLAAALLWASFTLPALADSSFPINGGTIAPSSSLELSTSKMRLEVVYSVNCTITNPNTVDIPISTTLTDSFLYCTIDGINTGFGGQCAVPAGEHKLRISNIRKYETYNHTPTHLRITNLDFDYSLSVKDCMAKPDTSW